MIVLRNHGVTAPAGFKASSAGGSVALLLNEGPDLSAAGVFTGEHPSASMLWTRQVLSAGRLRAVLLHAGSPGSTLSDDFAVTHHAAEHLAETLSGWGTATGAGEVAVCTTGGSAPTALLDVVAEAVHELAGGLSGGLDAARTVAGPRSGCTQAAVVHEDGWTVGAMAAAVDTVCVLSTDAVADAAMLLGALNSAESESATMLLLASGASEVRCSPVDLEDAVSTLLADLYAQGKSV